MWSRRSTWRPRKRKPLPWRRRKTALRDAASLVPAIREARRADGEAATARQIWRDAYSDARISQRHRARKRRKNPSLAIVTSPVKAALPIAAGLYASRFAANAIGPRVPGLSSLGQHAAPATAVGVLAVTSYVGPKVIKNQSTRMNVMLGMGISVIDTILKTYAPESLRAPIGVKDVYDDALNGLGAPYQEMGNYVEISDYVSD